jgi:1-acyl-sn-glycerol-3-phosphate acyltransferase
VLRPIFNAWAWTYLVLGSNIIGSAIVGLVWLVTAPFDPSRRAAGRMFRLMGVSAVKVNPLWHFRTEGTPPARSAHPFVAVSNHESYADIFLISHLPWEMKWLAKEQLFKIPCLGWMLRMANDVPLERGAKESILKAMNACAARLKLGMSVMIFPEGTRTPDGALLPFKDGAFRLAIENNVPILPIAVAGTRRAMAKGRFQFQPTRAICRVLEPISTAGMSLADVGTLKSQARAAIEAAKVSLHAELGLDAFGDPLRA